MPRLGAPPPSRVRDELARFGASVAELDDRSIVHLVPPIGRGGWWVHERGGALLMSRWRAGAIARVTELWVGAQRVPAWTAAGGPRTMRAAARLAGTVDRARTAAHQLRRPPSAPSAASAQAVTGTVPAVLAVTARCARDGLSDTERAVADAWLPAGTRLLDIGCGAGREAFGFAARGVEVVGIDVCPALLEAARATASALGVDVAFERCSMLDVAGAGLGAFDVVYVASDVYRSIPGRANRVAAIDACRSVLRPGGRVVLSAPVTEGRRDAGWRASLRRLAGHAPGDRWVRSQARAEAPWLYQHLFASAAEVDAELLDAGFRPETRLGPFAIARRPRLAAETAFAIADGVVAEAVADGVLVVDVARGEAFRLNASGRAVWEAVAAGQSLGAIAARLQQAGAPPARAFDDATGAVTALIDARLLRPIEDGAR